MNKIIHTTAIADDLRSRADEIAARAYEQGYRKQTHGQWLRDDTYQGTAKEIYRCSSCGHWQSVRKSNKQDHLMYMRFCPFCGSLNAAPAENPPKTNQTIKEK